MEEIRGRQPDLYQYASFPKDGVFRIRLLEILPGLPDAPIRCNLRDTIFDEHSPYETLSYTWGNEAATIKMLINSRFYLLIRPNLAVAIGAIRKRDESRILWIDAVCIDQSDLEHRSAQVSRMRDIYQQGQRTLAWLGPAADDSDLAMDLDAKDVPNDLDSALFEEPKWKSLMRLSGRLYWSRIWIVQEVTVQENVLILCGVKSRPWHELDSLFVAFFHLYERHVALGLYSKIYHTKSFRIGVLKNLLKRDYPRQGSVVTPLFVLDNQRDALSTDPRDKVYALLGLIPLLYRGARQYHLSQMMIDYALPPATIMEQTAARLVADFGLKALAFSHPGSRSNGLPSWVADWMDVRSTKTWLAVEQADPLFNVWKPLQQTSTITSTQDREAPFSSDDFAIDGSKLTVMAFGIDQVYEIAKFSFNAVSNKLLKRLEDACADSRNHMLYAKYKSEDAVRETFRRTLLHDMFGDERLEKRDLERFAAWVHASDGDVHADEGAFRAHVRNLVSGATLFFTANGFMGFSPEAPQKGDHLVLLKGCQFPALVRARDDGNYEWVGMAFVHGLMDGDVVPGVTTVDVVEQLSSISLV